LKGEISRENQGVYCQYETHVGYEIYLFQKLILKTKILN